MYHTLVLNAANNRTIMKALNDRHPQVRRIMQNAAILPERFVQCTLEHEEVARCILAGGGEGAYESMRRHLISTREHMMKVSYLKNY
jgi:DNA-binding GntR family transcriptional regulator